MTSREGSGAEEPPGLPSRLGRWVELVTVEPQYYEFLYGLATDEVNGFRWRFAGQVPRRDVFLEGLWKGILSQFVVTDRRSGRPVGTVLAYGADLQAGFVYIAGAMVAGDRLTGAGIEAFDLFVRYLFATWNFNKIYLEVPEFNLATVVGNMGELLHPEANLRSHTYYGGWYWDNHILAIYRHEFFADRTHSGRRIRSRPRERSR